MKTKNPGLIALERRVDELGLRQEVEEELSQILIEHKIAQLRKRRGLTQAALAQRSGVTQPMIAQIESGKLNNLTLKTLARTACALGASLKVDLVPRSKARAGFHPLPDREPVLEATPKEEDVRATRARVRVAR
jgi:transcriptional regulator with XRE-family HTH domain